MHSYLAANKLLKVYIEIFPTVNIHLKWAKSKENHRFHGALVFSMPEV